MLEANIQVLEKTSTQFNWLGIGPVADFCFGGYESACTVFSEERLVIMDVVSCVLIKI